LSRGSAQFTPWKLLGAAAAVEDDAADAAVDAAADVSVETEPPLSSAANALDVVAVARRPTESMSEALLKRVRAWRIGYSPN
jgi:hypothetical protein